MTVFLFLLGLLQCFAIWLLGRAGIVLGRGVRHDQDRARFDPPGDWPKIAVIVPASGNHWAMEGAMRSLAEQNYPNFQLIFVTATPDDPAREAIANITSEYRHASHVAAGLAETCGQKNHSHLAAIAQADADAQVFAFCDSTHFARPDFLRCLVAPIARGEASFTSGYHQVEPRDQGIVSLAYAISVMFMRFMQSFPRLAQPWGGAMAASRAAFERYNVSGLWSANVVDDCSLAALLAQKGARIALCPGALLRTFAVAHPLPVWRAWLERQILFLKFCMAAEWLALGLVCALMAIPPVWCIAACTLGIFGFGSDMAPFLALCWLCAIWHAIGTWRVFLPQPPWISHWLAAFFSACFMFAIVYAGTIFSNALLWHNIVYRVAPGGRVISMERR